MVTIDKIVKNVGKFNGKTDNHRMYERAKTNIESISSDEGMQKLEETLKKETGYNDFSLPREPQEYIIEKGGITFSVKSETTTKRPQYKAAVAQMENYINGINYLLSQERVITGVAKERGRWCVSVNTLLEQYELIIAGVKSPGIKQTVKYELENPLAKDDVPKEMDLSAGGVQGLNAESFRIYVLKDTLRDISEKYVKAYEKELKGSSKVKGIVAINTRKGYEEKNIKSEGTDWAYVAKTLVNDGEDEESSGELNILSSSDLSFEQKRKELPFYELFIREPFGEKTLYVGIESVYNRIQDLKDQKTLTSNTTKYVPKEIV